MSITIDGNSYDVPFLSIKRKFDALDKYAERTEDGVLQREMIGVYPNYDVVMGMSRYNISDYAALVFLLKQATPFHEVTMPDETEGSLTFDCYFAGVTDNVIAWHVDGTQYYRGLSFSIIAKAPYWT